MSMHLKTAEPPGPAIRRVCRQHVNRALSCLDPANRSDAVHDARKEIKALRAVFRLARGSMTGGKYRATAAAMRLAAKPLAAARDARVTLKALEVLAGGNAARQFPAMRAALTQNSRKENHRFKELDSAAVATYVLQTLHRQLAALKIKTDWNALQSCFKKSYCRGRDAAKLARLAPSPLHFHEWRKLAKNFWYQLDFLCPKWPAKTKAMVEGLENLGDLLGDDHDLVLLVQFAAGHGGSARETDKLKSAVEQRQKQLAAKIQSLGTRLFAPAPKMACRQIKRDWKEWR